MTNDSLGEQLYEAVLKITDVTEYGASLPAILAGESAPPLSGFRVDFAFEGTMTGRLAGDVRGVDYVNLRADGRAELDIKATIATNDGELIALAAQGVAIPQPDSTTSLVRESVKLTTASDVYSWVNPLQIWGLGTVDVATAEIKLRAYLPQ